MQTYMTPQEYEQIVSEIAQSIFERVEGTAPHQVKYGKKNRWVGASGYRHQIDVSVQSHQDLILVECKYWNKNVPAHAILTFFARVYDIRPTFNGQVHPVIVTKVGFQAGAEPLAAYYNINLQVIPSASAFGFMYKNLLLVQPAPATAGASTGNPTVVISDPKDGTS
jgi:hypothetical protein